MITGSDIVKCFDDHRVLDGLSIHVNKGSVYGLVGPNGSGKTTLIKHIVGIYRPDDGELLVDSSDVFENETVKGRMAYVSDDPFFFRSASVDDMAAYYKGIYPNFDTGRYERIMECFSSIHRKMLFRKMSKGMVKQASMILALATKPEILVLDEPMDGLDPVVRKQVWSLVIDIVAEDNMTVFVSSHNLRELEDVCDCVGIMDKGRVVLEKNLDDLEGDVHKVQVAYDDGTEVPSLEGVAEVLSVTESGKLRTLVVQGDIDLIEEKLKSVKPLLLDVIPLTLEEIFIYKLGGEGDEIKKIII